MNHVNGQSSVSYLSHLKKLYEEYEQLQLEFSRVRQQLNDQVLLLPRNENHIVNENFRTIDDIRNELESERSLTKSLKTKVTFQLNDAHRWQKLYYDLMNTVKNETGSELTNKTEYISKIEKLENENKELKENVDFMTSENSVLADSVKDLEETLFKERLEWLKEKDSHEEIVAWSHNIYEASNTNKLKIEEMGKQISVMEDFLDFVQNLIIEKKLLDDEKATDLHNCDQKNKIKIFKELLQTILLKLNSLNDESTFKTKIAELREQIESLQTRNNGLISENEELKRLMRNNNEIDFDQVKLKLEIADLTTKLSNQVDKYEQLTQKYSRNRKVWEENEKNLTEEIGKLDNFIAGLIETINKLPDNLKNCPELQEIITLTDQNEMDKSSR